MKKTIIFMLVIFAAGFALSHALNNFSVPEENSVFDPDTGMIIRENPTGLGSPAALNDGSNNIIIDWFDKPKDRLSPHDRISEDQIHVYPDRIVIDLPNAEWSRFTDTKSMDPVLDVGANSIRILPDSSEDVYLGDIISYRSDYADGIIIHRVVEIGEDEKGWYCRAKGDNNAYMDPGRIRFDQILGVSVIVIW